MEDENEYIVQDGRYLLSFGNHYLDSDYEFKFYSHYHHELEVSYVKSGSGSYVVGDRTYDIQQGDVFIFNNIEPHKISYINPQQKLVNSVIMFDPRFIWSIEGNLFDSKYLDPFFNRIEHFSNRLDRNNPDTIEIVKLFHDLEGEFLKKPPEYKLMVKVKLLNLLVTLIRYYGYNEGSEINHTKRKQDLIKINNIVDYIDHNFTKKIHQENIAKILHMNPSYSTMFFKKYLGVSPSEYISKRRVNMAIEYLKNTDKTMIDISGLCGFDSVSNFYKIFKKLSGKVPSNFR